MNANELRRVWNEFFGARGHTLVPSAGLIPHHPTAPMFTNSGMMQFVPYFLGEESVPYDPPRAASIQKCVRVGGKHNDLDIVGRSIRHLSFFEMLGNWSFGDYFKVEAIRWAWELITERFGMDPDRLWVTVHVDDDEASQIWQDEVGFPAERIQRFDKANFWEMGETGPCGPSSEIFLDRGARHGPDGGPLNPDAEDRFVEFWNLVFMQYFRGPDGSLTDLPSNNVDTGAGFERLLMLLNGYESLFESEVLAPVVQAAESVSGQPLGRDEETDVALRLVADHARSMTFLVNDGVIPSNEDRGYVLRRIIRRAVRYSYLLGVKTLITPPLVERTVEVMGDAYPDLRANHDRIVTIITREEERFRRTLERGSVLLDTKLAGLQRGDTLAGDVAFDLYETYGFPLEVTTEITEELGITVDQEGYEQALERAKAISRQGAESVDLYASLGDYQSVLERFGTTEFVGREELDTKSTVLAVVERASEPSDSDDTAPAVVDIFLDRTPFYAEAGGQVGDTGVIETDTGRAEVVDTTYALPGLHRHTARVVEGEITPGQSARAAIDVERRDAIRRNHTGTHVLHWALREVLGDHVKQQGSLVAPDRLRFDFGPSDALSPEQIAVIEDLANREILSNRPVRHFETTKEHAEALGAIAFFGDKYGDIVRVLEAGDHSIELCGGTHVRALGDIGPVKVVSESSIGSNLRRLEAITGTGTIDRLRREERLLAEVADLVNVPVDEVADGVRRRLDEARALRDEIKVLRRQAAAGRAAELAAEAVDGVVVARVDGVSREELRDLALAVRQRDGVRAVVLGAAPEGGGAALVSAVTSDSGLVASELIAAAATTIGGGGGRAADVAVAGGRDPSRLDEALIQARAAAAAS